MGLADVAMSLGSKPVCWFCKMRIPLDTTARATTPDLGLPTGVGVIICTPACPQRPPGTKVYRHPLLRSSRP